MSGPEAYLDRPITPADPAVRAAVERGPIDPARADTRTDLDRLLDPAPVAEETGWCRLPDGVAYVAVRTAMPQVTGPMVDWWFDWHPRAPVRYRIWHPVAHRSNAIDPPAVPGAKPHWGAVHHPVEDIGTGVEHLRIDFQAPTALGFSGDALDDPRVATIVGGFAGDERRRMQHTLMVHVFLGDGDGVVLRSRFWIGAAMRPYLPSALAAPLAWAVDRPAVRRRMIPSVVPLTLARHCAEEYANLAALLPELYERFGPG